MPAASFSAELGRTACKRKQPEASQPQREGAGTLAQDLKLLVALGQWVGIIIIVLISIIIVLFVTKLSADRV
jgi:tetrahydromethanopterin S-methyltransferase subunit B